MKKKYLFRIQFDGFGTVMSSSVLLKIFSVDAERRNYIRQVRDEDFFPSSVR